MIKFKETSVFSSAVLHHNSLCQFSDNLKINTTQRVALPSTSTFIRSFVLTLNPSNAYKHSLHKHKFAEEQIAKKRTTQYAMFPNSLKFNNNATNGLSNTIHSSTGRSIVHLALNPRPFNHLFWLSGRSALPTELLCRLYTISVYFYENAREKKIPKFPILSRYSPDCF